MALVLSVSTTSSTMTLGPWEGCDTDVSYVAEYFAVSYLHFGSFWVKVNVWLLQEVVYLLKVERCTNLSIEVS